MIPELVSSSQYNHMSAINYLNITEEITANNDTSPEAQISTGHKAQNM